MIFDAHADILTDMYHQYKKTGKLDSFRLRHYEKYKRADVKVSVFVNYTNPYYENEQIFNETFEIALKEIEANFDIMKLCLTVKDIEIGVQEDRIGVILGVEGCQFLRDTDHLHELYAKGLRHAILTWNETNQYGGGINDNSIGLTERGIEMIQEMERLGIIIDLSHANEKTYFDILKYTTKPVIVSHGNCRTLSKHKRNYTDEQLIALKNRAGVLGIAAIPNFISPIREEQTVENMAKHIDYAVKLIGIDHVGLGLDICFYLGGEFINSRVQGFVDIDQVENLFQCLRNLGYHEEEIAKIKYENFMRLIHEVLI